MKYSNRAGLSIYQFLCFDSWGNHRAHVRPRVKDGVAIIATDFYLGNCNKEANLLELSKVKHGRYASKKSYTILKGRGRVKLWNNLLPKWYPRKFCLSH